jgi:DNA-binding HxlR family transcriptional regulator
MMQVESRYDGHMLGRTYDNEVCSAARALELVGERWSLVIVRKALFGGARRFGDFQSLGIASNILSSRLDGFVGAGIMERRAVSAASDHVEYVLTQKGRELATVIIALTEWGDRWAAPAGAPVLYTHAVCGDSVTQRLECASCGRVHDPDEVRAMPGPGMPAELAERMLQRTHQG